MTDRSRMVSWIVVIILMWSWQAARAVFTVPDSVGLGVIYRQGTCTGATQISSTTGKTLKQCSNDCSATSSCQAFTWHETGSCSLRSDSCASKSTADPKNHHFDMLPFDFLHHPGGDCPGGDLAYLSSKTLSSCLNWCRASGSCKSANWFSKTGYCYPKSLVCADPLATGSNINNNFFVKTGSFDIVRGYVYSAGSCTGTDLLQLPRRTVKLCAWECTSRTTCRSFVWTKGTGDCQLKTDTCTASPATDKHMYVRVMTVFGWYATDNTVPDFLYRKMTEAELPSSFTMAGKTKKDYTLETDLVCAHRCASATCPLFKTSTSTCSIYT